VLWVVDSDPSNNLGIIYNFQVMHHPPVSALHATHEQENIDVTWCQYFTPKFRGMSFFFSF